MDAQLGARLIAGVESASHTILLCAPFMKRASIDRLLERCSSGLELSVFTRWFPEEIASGVSDTNVLEAVEQYGGSMLLCALLHAKYYRFDERALVGSANLTGAALGWGPTANLEVLVEIDAAAAEAVELERQLRTNSSPATAEIAAIIEEAAALITEARPARSRAVSGEDLGATVATFIPRLREPGSLYRAYREGTSVLSTESAAAADRDLAALAISPGLPETAFRAAVAGRLLQLPVVSSVDQFVTSQQRFGAVRDALGAKYDLDRAQADYAWQTLMRWLLEFLPQRYARSVPGHSELIERRSVDDR